VLLSANFSGHKVSQILREMNIAVRSRQVSPTIVILSEQEKSFIEDAISSLSLENLQVIVRTGCPTHLAALKIAG
jgi:hypothetical protein